MEKGIHLNPMTHADYFAGIGGFSLAAERAGIDTTYTCESNYFKHNWLKHRFPNSHHEQDIRLTRGMAADVFTAGFPCQDISVANPHGAGITGSRSGLWFTFFDIVSYHRPNYLVLENSPQIRQKGLEYILAQLASIGYNAEWTVINKRAFGFADWRKRFFCVAYPSQIRWQNSRRVFSNEHTEMCAAQVKQAIPLWPEIGRTVGADIWPEANSYALQADAGISRKLAKAEIEAYGDAVCPHPAQFVLELIKIHQNQ